MSPSASTAGAARHPAGSFCFQGEQLAAAGGDDGRPARDRGRPGALGRQDDLPERFPAGAGQRQGQ
jgi:hypothetical protein